MQNSGTTKILLAPMEGVVDEVVRELIANTGGVDYCVTEFLRVNSQLYPKKVYYRHGPELKNKSQTTNATPVIFQILGSDISAMAENAAQIAECGAHSIDLNFGCPAKTVNRHDGGASLLKNPERLFQVTSAVRRAVPNYIPVTAKVRLGYDHKNFTREIASACESGGAHWLAIHARTKAEGYSPPAHWEHIAAMKEAIKIPVIANGEIWSIEDFKKCKAITGCNDFMIGRGLIANPFLAREIKNFLTTGEFKKTPWLELKNYFFSFVDMSFKSRGNPYAITRTKQMVKQMMRAHPEAKIFFEKIKQIKSIEELNITLQNEFNTN